MLGGAHMNPKALYNLTYGVYLLSAQEDGKDNGCIINTAVQVANNPTRISIAAIKGNLTHDMIHFSDYGHIQTAMNLAKVIKL